MMTKEARISALNHLVDEITKDKYDDGIVRQLMAQLRIPYCDDPMQLLNNVLKGIHIIEEPSDEEPEQLV